MPATKIAASTSAEQLPLLVLLLLLLLLMPLLLHLLLVLLLLLLLLPLLLLLLLLLIGGICGTVPLITRNHHPALTHGPAPSRWPAAVGSPCVEARACCGC